MKGNATSVAAGIGQSSITYFYGKNRRNSDKNGFTCWLCEAHHRGTYGVHGKEGAYLDNKLKRECQEVYELNHTRKEFRHIIGKSYLEDDT